MSVCNELLNYMIKYNKLYMRMLGPTGESYDLSPIEIHILLFLKNHPDLNTARDMEKYRGLAKSNISTALEHLRSRDYLQIQRDSQNRRLNRIFLLESGEAAAQALQHRQQEFFQTVMKDIPENLLEAAEKFYQLTCRNIDTALAQTGEERDSHAV